MPAYAAPELLEARIAPALIFGLDRRAADTSQHLILFDSAKPGVLLSDGVIGGLPAGDILVGMDFRPADGLLYGVTTNLANEGKLFTINTSTRAATQVGGVFGVPLNISADSFDVDFNPQVDRLRVVSSSGQNFRVIPTDGTVVDTNPFSGGVQPDVDLEFDPLDLNAGKISHIGGIAYTDSRVGSTSTQIFALDSTLNILALLNPPNDGKLTTQGPLKADPGAVTGFDILPGSLTGFASFSVNNIEKLYSINLATGAAKLVGNIGTAAVDLVSLAMLPSGLGIVGKTATFRDVDGDAATLTVSKGTLLFQEFSFSLPNALGGVQLQQLDLSTAQGGFSGAAVVISAKGSAFGGNGHVDVGFMNATNVNLLSLSLRGDLGRLNVGTTANDGLAISTLQLGSVAGLGLTTQSAGATTAGLSIDGSINTLTITHNAYGDVGINGPIKNFTVGGSLQAQVFAAGVSGSLKLGSMVNGRIVKAGDVKAISSGFFSGAVIIGGALGSLTVRGDLAFTSMSIAGHLNPATTAAALTLGSLTVTGHVYGSGIFLGYNDVGVGVNPDTQTGPITVGGSWNGANFVAGIMAGADTIFGTNDDLPISGGNASIPSRIASIVIKGEFLGTGMTGAVSGFLANQIGSATLGGVRALLTPGVDFLGFGGNRSAIIREV